MLVANMFTMHIPVTTGFCRLDIYQAYAKSGYATGLEKIEVVAKLSSFSSLQLSGSYRVQELHRRTLWSTLDARKDADDHSGFAMRLLTWRLRMMSFERPIRTLIVAQRTQSSSFDV